MIYELLILEKHNSQTMINFDDLQNKYLKLWVNVYEVTEAEVSLELQLPDKSIIKGDNILTNQKGTLYMHLNPEQITMMDNFKLYIIYKTELANTPIQVTYDIGLCEIDKDEYIKRDLPLGKYTMGISIPNMAKD